MAVYLKNLSLRIQEILLEIIILLHNEICNQHRDIVI